MQDKITSYAKTLGFDLVGFSPANPDKSSVSFYEKWLKEGKNADMQYLEKVSPRRNLKEILPNAKTVIVLGMNYYHKQKPLRKGYGRVARYAYGRDYHKIIGKKLKKLEAFIKTLDSNAETKSYVDTGPILERSFAEQAGVGVVGKNSCLITKEFGSWIFLAEIITSLSLKDCHPELLPAGRHGVSGSTLNKKYFSLCGSCTRCMDACPTKAIVAPGVIDSHKCISYLTIENKGKIPEKFREIIKKFKRIYGCDICQEVCPHNCRTKENVHEELRNSKIAGDELSVKKILEIKSDENFLKLFAGSPLMRAKRKGLTRNMKILE